MVELSSGGGRAHVVEADGDGNGRSGTVPVVRVMAVTVLWLVVEGVEGNRGFQKIEPKNRFTEYEFMSE